MSCGRVCCGWLRRCGRVWAYRGLNERLARGRLHTSHAQARRSAARDTPERRGVVGGRPIWECRSISYDTTE
jgi:hypothetical protein